MRLEEIVRKIIETDNKLKEMYAIAKQLNKLEIKRDEGECGKTHFEERTPFLVEEFRNHAIEIVESLQDPEK